jgi:hypothetical protein
VATRLRGRESVAMLTPMPQLGRILALLAAIMLMIGTAPAVAATQSCEPCPPDCPMMKMLSPSKAGDAQKAPSGKGENPCKPGVLCQASAPVTPAPPEASVRLSFSFEDVDHRPAGAPLPASHQPDRSLRPPIQL